MSGFLGMFVGGAAAPGPVTIGAVTILSSTSVSVAFTPPTSDGGSPILDYTVTSSPGSITATGASSPITVTGLTPGITYTFTVTARNAVGGGLSSSPSGSVQVWSVPDAPTSVSATAGNGQATVSFSAPSYNGGKTILDYRVTSSPGGITATGSGSPITITGLSNGTAYTFTVQARNEIGYSSASSPSNSVTPVVPPVSASGGSYIYDGTGSYTGYRFHVFTGPGTFRVSSNENNYGFASVIVGGGGAGSVGRGGGGGGGVSDVTGISLTPNTDYPVVVGSGGSGSFARSPEQDGQPSSWYGGGAGGGTGGSAPNGASKISGSPSGSGYGGGNVNRPGTEGSNLPMNGGGGGGAGGDGQDSRYWYNPPQPPKASAYSPKGYPQPYDRISTGGGYMGGGGIGITSSIDGIQYGGGGAGGPTNNGTYTNGLYTPEDSPGNFIPYGGGGGDSSGAGSRGGGGGGGGGAPNSHPAGGSGIVVIRYPYP